MKSASTAILILLMTTFAGVAEQHAAAKDAEKPKSIENTAQAAESKKQSKDDSSKASAEKKTVKTRLAHIKISGEMPESPGQMSLFGDLGVDLRKTIARLDKAATDKRIAGVILEIRPASLSRGKLNELREAVGRVRAAGKKVVASVEIAMGSQYLLASACDEIVMPEASMIVISGVHAEVAYYKEMLGKIGIEADMMHVGESKGAAEPLTRTNMSEPVRENLTALIDDVYDQMITTIATDRNLKVDEVRTLVDRGLLTVEKAHEAGLVDRIAYPDELRAALKKEYEADELVYVMNYGKKGLETDFSGPMGMIKLFQQIMGVGSGRGGAGGPKIAIVYAVGPIMSGKSESSPFGGQSMGSDTIVKALEKAAEDKDVKAIVFRINSPGGSALASDLIWRATQKVGKPIVASMGDVAASGGYYIAMGADRIVAEPGTVTGSIGVVGGKLSMRGMYDKIGISTDKITRGKNSGMFISPNKFSESEREVVEEMMQDVYRIFTSKAAKGRDMPLDELKALAGGKVYTGRDAKRNGLVDDLGTLKDAIRIAKKMAGLDPNEKAGLKVLPEPENPFESLFGADLDKEREVKLLQGITQLAPELTAPLRYAHQLRGVMREPVTLVMPYWLDIK